MKMKKLHVFIILAIMTFLHVGTAYAAGSYVINNKTIRFTDFSSSPGECWAYANNVYNRIWGTSFSSEFSDSNNMLRNLADNQLLLNPDNLKKYISCAPLGASLRICNAVNLHSHDGYISGQPGHNQIIVQKDANGFTVVQGGLSASPHCNEQYYTWTGYCNTSWLGGTYHYIKYIKWPNAQIINDSSKPTISNILISNLDAYGYTISCVVSDNVGVTEVKFPTWTINGDQDDLVWHVGRISGNTATFTIKTSDHKNETGDYITDIYAFDSSGNAASARKTVKVPIPTCKNDSSSSVATDTLNSHKYELYDYSMSWKEARDFCKNRGGHLVTITSSAENNLVTKLIQRGKKGHYFIGCTDEGSIGTWRWITGEAFNYENWDKAGEPSNNVNEIVGTIVSIDNPPNKQTGEWVDVENKNTSTSYYSYANTGFVCEYEPIKTVSIASAKVTGLGNKVWTGKKLVPSLGVTVAGTKLVKGTHYTVSCTNNVNVGTAKITIKGKGKYTGSLTKSFKIIPRTTSVTVSKGKKRFIARWKLRIPQTSGYQLQYSTNRSFKSFYKNITISNNFTLSKNVTNLKSKTTYYVRIRTYKLVGSKKYYSNWSKTVTVKPI